MEQRTDSFAPQEIDVTYINWRGETSRRRIRPLAIRFGTTEWHPDPGWLMLVVDVERNVTREFAVKDMIFPDGAIAEAERRGVASREPRITELLAANNREITRRRVAEGQAAAAQKLSDIEQERRLVAEAEAASLQKTFDLQWKRMGKATEMWRAEDPVARALVIPDLGRLLAWLMERKETIA